MTLFKRAVPGLVAALFLVSLADAGPAPSGVERAASVEGITEYRLEDGLKVLLFPDPTKPTVTVNITYLVGSRNEGLGETGMAHLLEHLMFKGSKGHPNIPQELTSHGARPNGTTWFDRTNYFETFSASEENLRWALELEADRMVNSFISRKDLDSEMTVVRNEFELGENDPSNVLEERVLSTAYLWHNYGHSTIGARSDIENVPIDRLQAFYRTYYQPDNAVLLMAGKFDEEKTLGWIHEVFARVPRPARTLPAIYTAEPVQDGERAVTLRRVGDVQALAAAYHVPPGAHPDAAAVDVMTEVLADTPSGRLYKALVETGKASSVSGYFQALHDPGFVMFKAEVRTGASLEAARSAMLETLDGAASKPPAAEEVERARAKLLKNMEMTLNVSSRVGLELSEWIGMGDWRLFFIHRDRLRKVTPEEVGQAAARYLKPSNRTIGAFVPTARPDRSEVPPAPDVASLVKDYKGDPAVARGEDFDASPSNIDSRTSRTALANGMKLALLPKRTRGATVVAALTLRFGDEKSVHGRSTAAMLAADMLPRGTRRHTRQQIRDELDRLKARVSVSGGATLVTISVETMRVNLAAVLRLVAEILREPSFPENELELLRQETLTSIEEQKSEPTAIASTAFHGRLNPYPRGDVRHVSTPEERIEEVKAVRLEELRQFYSGFYGASNAQLSVVGDFDAQEIASLSGELFGGWKSPRPFERVPLPYQRVSAGTASFETPDKANAFFIAGENLEIRDDDPDYPALVLANYIFGGGFLNSRLAVRIRQKEGISYGVGSVFSANPLDRSGSFTVYAIYAPQNAGRLETAIHEELARALKEGFSDREAAEAKSGYLQARQVSRSQDAELVRLLNIDLFLDRTLSWDDAVERKISELDPRTLVEAMRRRIDLAAISEVKAGDFSKAAPAGK
jgi:zinc protease